MIQKNGSILLVGGGKMGSALLQGWIRLGIDPSLLILQDPHISQEHRAALEMQHIRVNLPHPDMPALDAVILAIKPQIFAQVAKDVAPFCLGETLILSIMAGTRVATLQNAFPQTRYIVRTMPNTPAAIGQGITGAYAAQTLPQKMLALASKLLDPMGTTEWLTQEQQIDTVTAISGSGPAYVFYFTECLAKAGEALGLDPMLARRLARRTVEGSGALMAHTADSEIETLRQNVTSPGGTTAAALEILMQEEAGGLLEVMLNATQAAKRRAEELGKG